MPRAIDVHVHVPYERSQSGAPGSRLAQIAQAVAIAIALDSTLIGLVLVPAAMRLMGSANWWLPQSIGRVLP